jgi:TorA maturation chaperone TorD
MRETEQRLNFYALLSNVLMQECDRELLTTILDNGELMEMLPALKAEAPMIREDMERYIDEVLNVDFTNLFLLHLTPYESFYKREDGMMNTGGSNPVVQFYEEYDFQIDLTRARTVSADQIGCEMEFMHVLVGSEIKALGNNDRAARDEILTIEKRFMKEHLLSWAPLFLLQVKNEAETAFYREFADMALDFLFADYETITKAP